jgi:hypothetical protein
VHLGREESAATAVGRELCPRRSLVCRQDGRGAGGSACYGGAVRPGGRRFSITVKMNLKITAVITAVGLGVPGGLAVAGVGLAAAPVGLG